MRISAGGRTDPARLGQVPLTWPGTAQLVPLLDAAEPYWELEVTREGRWANVGNEVSRVLNNFADEEPSGDRFGPSCEPLEPGRVAVVALRWRQHSGSVCGTAAAPGAHGTRPCKLLILGGPRGARTRDLLIANQALSQLS